MESDDDFDVFSPPQDSSLLSPSPKLKRLKKKKFARVSRSPDPILNSAGIDLPIQVSDSLRSSNGLVSEDPADKHRRSLSGSVGSDGEREWKSGFDDLNSGDGLLEREIDLGMEEDSAEMDVLDERRENSSGEMEENLVDLRIKKSGFDDMNFHDDWLERERDLGEEEKERDEMDDLDAPIEGSDEIRENSAGEREKTLADLKSKKSDKKRRSSEENTEKKEKTKRTKGGVDNGKPKISAAEKRKAEKERIAYLDQLHAESQRLLRETRDAQFKPAPIVQKPISSILEKIRQRKLEVSKKAVSVNSYYSYAAHSGGSSEDIVSNFPSQRVQNTENLDDEPAKEMDEEPIPHPVEAEGSPSVANVDGSGESSSQSAHETSPSQKKQSVDEGSSCAFRAPVDDTQDLFGDSQTSDLPLDDEHGSPLEEEFAPSSLTMQLKFDSAPVDDDSPDEENKENLDPHSHGLLNECSSPKGVPVKDFLDDEAEEEDDSDNDLSRFKEADEDGDEEDAEELNDLIATTYEEKPVDNEKRNELHQKWLEEQDAVGTDNLLQRLNYASKLGDTILLDEEEEMDIEEEEEDNDDDEDDEFDDLTADDAVPINAARANLKKVKQMIPQMFTDKDDGFISSDDEKTERNLLKQRILAKRIEEGMIQPPAEDESSRGIFSLIKKMNVVPDMKKKAKASSFFDMQLSGGKSNNSSKSSFLHRATNHSLQSSKHKSVAVKSFIFGRDDSNSRSTISTAEDSSDLNHSENQPTKVASVKFSSSQSRSSSQKAKLAVETTSSTSLFEILKGSSVQSNHCSRGNVMGQTQTVFAALKSVKKSIKIEGRS